MVSTPPSWSLLAAAPPAVAAIDLVIIVAYLVLVLGFGMAFGRYAKTTSDFFFGGRRFSWWLVGISCVATTVGSYSFVKYSQAGFEHGLASTQTYLNDWFLMPLFLFGWFPIIYYARVTSVPEYFERRFDARARLAATVIILLYLVGYVGYNFFTVGVALKAMLGWDMMTGAAVVAVVAAAYLHFGGQTSVIMTDLFQGVLLLAAGFLLLLFGLDMIGGPAEFWAHFSPKYRVAFAGGTQPEKFPGVGIFWQDGLANGIAFYFMNQGILMRFLCVRSVREGRKAAVFVVMLLMPLAAVAVSNAGWIGRALVDAGLMDASVKSEDIFVRVAEAVGGPGFFGLLMAALIAALMSTADSLINATSAIVVNDFYKPYVNKSADDTRCLHMARVAALATAGLGLFMAWIFSRYDTQGGAQKEKAFDLIGIHANFVATVTPPMVVAIVLGAFWPRYGKRGALWTLLGGSVLMVLTYATWQPWGEKGPELGRWLLSWFSHGMGGAGDKFTRAIYGIATCGAVGVVGTLLFERRGFRAAEGLVLFSLQRAKERFKGGRVFEEGARPLLMTLDFNEAPAAIVEAACLRCGLEAPSYPCPACDYRPEEFPLKQALAHGPEAAAMGLVEVHDEDLRLLSARLGDILVLSDPRWWFGGLRSVALRAVRGRTPGLVRITPALAEATRLPEYARVRVERVL